MNKFKSTVVPPPPQEADQLNWFIGDWRIQSRYRADIQSDQWIEEKAESTASLILKGHALLETFSGTLNGETIEGISIRTYNLTRQKWEQRWKDTNQSGFAEFTGEFKDAKFMAYNNAGYKDAENGILNEKASREVFWDIQRDHFLWKLEVTRDGGQNWRTIWTLDYTRR